MRSLYKIIADYNEKAKRYFLDPLFYVRKIKERLQKGFPDVRVLIFGSAVRGDYQPGSDIDILIIASELQGSLEEQARIKIEIKSWFPDAPFEIHLAIPEQYESWYKKFIKDDFLEA